MKIDKRIKYLIMLDTETCNTPKTDNKLDLSNALVYDIGFQVVDKKGRVYEKYSFIVSEVFFGMAEKMQTAYYKAKIPTYFDDVVNDKREIQTFQNIRKILVDVMRKYNTKTVVAHNAYFDVTVLNRTQQILTDDFYRYFFPFGTIIWDTQKMAVDTICKQKSYIKFCQHNGYMTKHTVPRVRQTAEIIYRYLSGDSDFQEAHTGLEDTEIETKILAHCFRQHKPMRKEIFAKREG